MSGVQYFVSMKPSYQKSAPLSENRECNTYNSRNNFFKQVYTVTNIFTEPLPLLLCFKLTDIDTRKNLPSHFIKKQQYTSGTKTKYRQKKRY